MQATVVRFIFRAIACVPAAIGLLLIYVGLSSFALSHTDMFDRASGVIFILLGAYISYAGYILWFRLSPEVVRLTLGLFAFMLFGTTRHLEPAVPPEYFFFYLGGVGLVVYLLYQWLVSYCCRCLFPSQLADASPQVRHA